MPLTLSEWSIGARTAAALARLIPWRRIVPTAAAKWFGVLTLRVETCRKDFRNGGAVIYTMTQAWIANATRLDVRDARVTVEWRRKGGGRFDGRRVHGIWCKKLASGLASYPSGVEEMTALPSNGDDRHLGLAVRSAKTGKTYLVCTETYYAGSQYPNYEHPDYVLSPGIYEVDALIEAQGGKEGRVHLEVQHAGGDSSLLVFER